MPEPSNLRVHWRDVFAAPLETRARVEDALAQPDCLVAEGYYRPDRRDACAAADLATLGILHEACVPFLGRDAYADWEGEWAREFERLDEEVPDQGDVYNRRRSILEEARIHFAWRLQKCRAVPPDALAPLAALPTPPPHYDNPDWHQGYAMIRAALRLGDDWALAHMIASNATVNVLWQSNRTAAYLHRAGKAFVRSSGPEIELAYLMVAMAHDIGARQSRFDWSGWSNAFTAAEIDAAQRIARETLASGWVPLPETQPAHREERASAAEPRDPSKVVVRRWITEDGKERAMTADGTVLVTGSEY